MSNSTTITLENVTFNYARIGRAFRFNNDVNETPQFTLQAVAEPGTDAYDTLAALVPFINVQEDEESGALVLNLRQYTHNRRGQEQYLNVFDADFNPMTQAQREHVGDGSKGHVVFYAYEHNNAQAAKPMATRMTDVVVTEVVDYTPVNGSVAALRGEQTETTSDVPSATEVLRMALAAK